MAEKRTNKFNPHMTPSVEIEPHPHWWKTSALTTTATMPPTIELITQLGKHFSAASRVYLIGLLFRRTRIDTWPHKYYLLNA